MVQTIVGQDLDEKTQREKKSHPNSDRLHYFLLQKLALANGKLLELENEKKRVSSNAFDEITKPLVEITKLWQTSS